MAPGARATRVRLTRERVRTGAAVMLIVALAGCAATPTSGAAPSAGGSAAGSLQPTRPTPSISTSPTTSTTDSSTDSATHSATDSSTPASPPPTATPSRAVGAPPPPRPAPVGVATLSIPSIRLSGLRVVPYTGHPDDRPGTRIQDRGVAASPRGGRGGVGPGEIGNYIVTGHRTSHGAPFRRLPAVRDGDHILVTAGGRTYDYQVTGTMKISFRSARDLARQSAPVPGHPGMKATRPMITVSTCATPEDHAEGNYWTDELGNPEHRIDKVGVLVAVRT